MLNHEGELAACSKEARKINVLNAKTASTQ
jgi:hypothetical protein